MLKRLVRWYKAWDIRTALVYYKREWWEGRLSNEEYLEKERKLMDDWRSLYV